MSKRAILYARVSGDDRDKDGRNLKGQMDMCREYAQDHGYTTIVAELAENDRGASGATFELPELGRALEMARAGQADVLVTRELDRFARGLAKQLIVEGELNRAGVAVEYVLGEYPDTPEGQLMKNVRAVIAEYEREKTIERTVRARRLKVKSGSVLMHARTPYGYRVVDVDGKWELQVHEPEAQIVRLVFEWYTIGNGDNGPLSMRAITKDLTDMGVPTWSMTNGAGTGARPWAPSTLQKMLSNETYTGTWYYGKNHKNGQNPLEHWIAVDVPPLVDRAVWDAAQKRLQRNKAMSRRNTKNQYLLSRRVTCGDCGYKMGALTTSNGRKSGTWPYYHCGSRYRSHATTSDCHLPQFRADHTDATVWEWIKSFFADPAALAHGLQTEQADREAVNRPLRQRLAVIDDLLGDDQKQLDKLLDLYLAGDFPREMLTERKTRLETTIAALQWERSGLAAQIEAQTLTAEQVQTIVDFAATIREAVEEADADFTHRRNLIELLDVQATLTIEDGQKVVYARCLVGEETLPIVSPNSHSRE
ncbi:MAG: recombinase family protein [Chloroflexi bacterium]|nr:recombinase family protein [Chloroflexota bacterium]MBU1748215.1 recombinase family protein [Chloroflexota bacterium]